MTSVISTNLSFCLDRQIDPRIFAKYSFIRKLILWPILVELKLFRLIEFSLNEIMLLLEQGIRLSQKEEQKRSITRYKPQVEYGKKTVTADAIRCKCSKWNSKWRDTCWNCGEAL